MHESALHRYINYGNTIMNLHRTIFEFDRPFGGRIIRRLFSGEADPRIHVVHVVCLAFCLNDPHWNGGVRQMTFVEVKNGLFYVLTVHGILLLWCLYRVVEIGAPSRDRTDVRIFRVSC